ncbi:MAG TPA: 2-amino-4-hydroxy-6-hydroxymethyldihydropteridine diphosphokinase [Verrucomicrobiae bacterium]|jgi:2-amino-4-hydroxy-6-hydroxymethyldihydropteridine diphosphokinase
MALADENSRLAYIALGANLGDPYLTFACVAPRLQAFSTTPVIASQWMRSKPLHCPPGSPDFLNGVVAIRPFPGETPETLLEKLQALEAEFGRTPKKEMNEARPLDLDLITFGNEQRDTERLTLPHPRAREREFVLRPLAEIAPDLVLPGQDKNVIELLQELDYAPVGL